MRYVDLNADLGEEVTDDAGLLGVVTSANLACGYHAGSVAIMRAVCEEAARLGVSIGAQVSYADREHFGRRPLDVAAGTLREQVADQVGMLVEIAQSAGTSVRYLKPHGALYHRTTTDPEQARAVLEGSGGLPVLGMPGVLLDLAAGLGREVRHEGFPDRGYDASGRLVPRGEPGALLEGVGTVADQALRLLREPPGGVAGLASLCVHGDSPGAVEHARAVRAALEADGWTLRGL
ncbi:UPF0271 protein [Nocardioides salarius]|uniref:UPF0271 protein n=1 Tax=Nocardioides salarius TaxID=374513 RepID=A0ABS2MG28_9ACTN|nr:5-oxoprolinase subunit PxpA [Nocardioides salarius]MBM7510158.1 UPF0271 protein [Nocardioides salarius]